MHERTPPEGASATAAACERVEARDTSLSLAKAMRQMSHPRAISPRPRDTPLLRLRRILSIYGLITNAGAAFGGNSQTKGLVPVMHEGRVVGAHELSTAFKGETQLDGDGLIACVRDIDAIRYIDLTRAHLDRAGDEGQLLYRRPVNPASFDDRSQPQIRGLASLDLHFLIERDVPQRRLIDQQRNTVPLIEGGRLPGRQRQIQVMGLVFAGPQGLAE